MSSLLRTVCLTLCLFGATVFVSGQAASAYAEPAVITAAQVIGISNIESATDTESKPVITTRLVSSHSEVTPGQTIQLAWEFQLKPHWHIYWSNAGDSGLPPELKSKLNGNTEAQSLVWPTPKLISIPPVTNYGYEDSVTFTSNFTVPKGLASGLNMVPFSASFLYCNDVCMPGKTELKLPLTIGTKSVANAAFKPGTNLPNPLPARSGITAETTGQSIQLTLPLNLAATGVRFVPSEDGVIDDSAPQSLTGNLLSIPLDPQAEKRPDNLDGLLLLNGQGYQFTTPLHQTSVRSSTNPPQTSDASTSSVQASFIGAVFFAFIAGVILNLMPCVLPVLSLKLLSLVRHHHGPSRVRHTLAYTAGVVSSFWVFALVIFFVKDSGAQLGWGFHLQNPLFVATLVLLLLAVALNFFGIFEVGQTLTRLGAKPSKNPHHPSLLASGATGALAVIVATPCTVPFMGGAMAYALSQSLFTSLIIFTSLGLGMSLPFLIAIPYPAVFKWLPKPGAWMSTFRHALGWPMLATALWLAYVFASQTSQLTTFLLLGVALALSFTLWLYGTRSSLKTAAVTLLIPILGLYAIHSYHQKPQTLVWQPWSSAAVEAARKTGNPVFVDFTADWCLTCKVTEATVLNTETVQNLFTNTKTALFQADWTSQNPEITQELARHNRKGVPLYLLYLPGKEAEILPQLLTPGLFREKLTPTSQ